MNLFGPINEKYYSGEVKYYTFSEAIKILNYKEFGRNRLFKLLRSQGWLDQWNCPTNNHLALTFIKTVENKHLTPLISYQGISYIKNELL